MNMVIGLVLVATPLRPAIDEPLVNEEQIEQQLKAVQQKADELRKQIAELRGREEALRKELASAKTRPTGGIRATVRGVLRWNDDGGGYFILTRAVGGDETRVWLRISENRVLVRRLENLTGKDVVASGPLSQMPANTRTHVPPLGVFLEGFTIEPLLEKQK